MQDGSKPLHLSLPCHSRLHPRDSSRDGQRNLAVHFIPLDQPHLRTRLRGHCPCLDSSALYNRLQPLCGSLFYVFSIPEAPPTMKPPELWSVIIKIPQIQFSKCCLCLGALQKSVSPLKMLQPPVLLSMRFFSIALLGLKSSLMPNDTGRSFFLILPQPSNF